MTTTTATDEVLPPGVGRVPQWWMDITPHYTIDEDEEEHRIMERNMLDFYYQQMADLDEAGYRLDAEGNVINKEDVAGGSEWTPKPWKKSGGSNASNKNAVLDPQLFGILPSDPNYQMYLTGAKLPPNYFAKMQTMIENKDGQSGILNNLKQTDYGRYGRQAEKPAFQPSWAKKKLRSTSTGANIRNGHYDDSPNKFVNRRRVVPPPSWDDDDDDRLPNIPSVIGNTNQEEEGADEAPVVDEEGSATNNDNSNKQPMTRTVRRVTRGDNSGNNNTGGNTSIASRDNQPLKKYEHAEYMQGTAAVQDHELRLREQQDKLRKLQELQRKKQQLLEQQQKQKQQEVEEEEAKRQQQALLLEKQRELKAKQQQLMLQQRQQQQQQVSAQSHVDEPHHEQEYDEESYEEEIIEEDEFTEGSYEEEIIEEDDDVHDELDNLQAILAAKQAELKRLQQHM